MRLIFLAASNGKRLSKTVTPTETLSYPNVKNMTSNEVICANLVEFEAALRKESNAGKCLLKGLVSKPLVDESRAGFGDRFSNTDWMVLDIDGLVLDTPIKQQNITSKDVEGWALDVIRELPTQFHGTSFIAQASSSLGRKSNRLSMHIYFELSLPMPPKAIKLWLQEANLKVQRLKNQLELSVNGQSLKFVLDPSVADNSKLIFTAPPTFTNKALDPFRTPDDRIVRYQGVADKLNLVTLIGPLDPSVVQDGLNSAKDELRKKHGKKAKAAKTVTIQRAGQSVEVLSNAEPMQVNITDDSHLPFLRCNVNNGDSGAYYINVEDHKYLHNFKGEPSVELERVDPDCYALVLERYVNKPDLSKPVSSVRPVVFREHQTDTYFAGVYDFTAGTWTEEFKLAQLSLSSIAGFMRNHGAIPPDPVPDAAVVCAPAPADVPPQLEHAPFYVNLCKPAPFRDTSVPPATKLGYGEAYAGLGAHCPTIHTVIRHMLGDGIVEFEHFINWLAYIYQTRTKAQTAWVLQGVPGTGKGVFTNQILVPLFRQEHVAIKTLENIEEQYNGYLRTALFMVVDEFRMADAKGNASKIAEKLKNQITEPTISIRAMRSNQVEVPSYVNYIFLSNRIDAMKFDDGDRRYNVGCRQETMLQHAYPDMMNTLMDDIKNELPNFAGALETFKVDKGQVGKCLSNDAKLNMKNVSLTLFDDFCGSINRGDINAVTEVLDIELTNTFNSNAIMSAQKLARLWLIDAYNSKPSFITSDQLRNLYQITSTTTDQISPKAFTKMLNRHNIVIKPHRPPGSDPLRCTRVTWSAAEKDPTLLSALVTQYIVDPREQSLLHTKPTPADVLDTPTEEDNGSSGIKRSS